MIRGIYTAAAGLATATLRMGVVSNNVANAATPGFKQDRLPDEVGKALDLQRYAVDAQGNPIGTINLGPQVGVSQLDLAPGPMQETANPLDLAIGGNGFFTVQAADGTPRYTRDGGFALDAGGTLRARDGSAVLDPNGQPIQLPAGQDISVAADGSILAGGAQVAQLGIVEFPAGQNLVKQGNVEGSNVDMTESMVSTMNLVRAYEANQQLLKLQDETLKSTVNEVGKV
jgi:flagellar basal-body rod protein FlgG